MLMFISILSSEDKIFLKAHLAFGWWQQDRPLRGSSWTYLQTKRLLESFCNPVEKRLVLSLTDKCFFPLAFWFCLNLFWFCTKVVLQCLTTYCFICGCTSACAFGHLATVANAPTCHLCWNLWKTSIQPFYLDISWLIVNKSHPLVRCVSAVVLQPAVWLDSPAGSDVPVLPRQKLICCLCSGHEALSPWTKSQPQLQ